MKVTKKKKKTRAFFTLYDEKVRPARPDLVGRGDYMVYIINKKIMCLFVTSLTNVGESLISNLLWNVESIQQYFIKV